MKLRALALGIFACAISLPVARAAAAAAVPASTTPTYDERDANRVMAIVEDKVITMADVLEQLRLSQPSIAAMSTSQKEYDDNIAAAADQIVQDLIDRELIIRDFYKLKPGQQQAPQIPATYIDQEIERQKIDQFGGDESQFLNYLKSLGMTRSEYRDYIEEQIIYDYQRQLQRSSQSIVSPVKIETYYRENRNSFFRDETIHMRLLQLTRQQNETDDQLQARLQDIVEQFKSGAPFSDLVTRYSTDTTKRSQGGDYGEQPIADMQPVFSDASMTLEKGEISAPIVQGSYGYLIYAEDREHAGIRPIDEVRDQIEQILTRQIDVQSTERYLEKLRRDAYIRIF